MYITPIESFNTDEDYVWIKLYDSHVAGAEWYDVPFVNGNATVSFNQPDEDYGVNWEF